MSPEKKDGWAPRAIWGILVAGLLTVGVIAAVTLFRPASPPPESYGTVPSFALTDQEGAEFSDADLRDSVWLVNFIFTRCRGTCPILTNRMKRLATQLKDESRVQFLSLSVDPEFDTPLVLTEYASTFDLDLSRWTFLTGGKDRIRSLIMDGFFLAVEDGSGKPEEPILHSTRIVLVDGEGGIRGYYDALDDEAMDRLVIDVFHLLRAG